MINHMVFVFPFAKEMSEHDIDLQLSKLRKVLNDPSVAETTFIGLRGCTMGNHLQFAWNEPTADDFKDGSPLIDDSLTENPNQD